MKKLLLPVALAILVSAQGFATPRKPRAPQRPASARFVPATSIWIRIGALFRKHRPSCGGHSLPPPCPDTPTSGG